MRKVLQKIRNRLRQRIRNKMEVNQNGEQAALLTFFILK